MTKLNNQGSLIDLTDYQLERIYREAVKANNFYYARQLEGERNRRVVIAQVDLAKNTIETNEKIIPALQQSISYQFMPVYSSEVVFNKSTLKETYKKDDYVFVGKEDDPISSHNIKTIFKVNDKTLVLEDEKGNQTKVSGDAVHKLSDEQITQYLSYQKIAFDSVIMSDEHREAILEALKQVSLSSLIFDEWGFRETMEKGRAISFLFYGEPGTGKTLTAQAIADYLGKKLEVIGTGEIQSSEPGQAERNIKAYFEKSGSDKVLLFDECDSLVHSRNNTGSIMAAQINALLTALEHYEGVVMFTTNRLGVLDEAFNRRLSLKLEFPMPTIEQRLEIWKRMFPSKAPLDKDINWEKLAALELTGGYIKNIVLRAARSAAAQGMKTINYEVLKKSAQHEVKSKREFEHAAREHRNGGVTTIDQAIQDFGTDNKLTLDTKNGSKT